MCYTINNSSQWYVNRINKLQINKLVIDPVTNILRNLLNLTGMRNIQKLFILKKCIN